MPSQSTTFFERIYTGLALGGVGLVGESNDSPSLRASIFGKKFNADFQDLSAVIKPITSGQTLSNNLETVYTSFYFGGVGIIGSVKTPDLRAAYTFVEGAQSGTLDLRAWIVPIESGTLDLGAFWRSAESGSLNLEATYTGVDTLDLSAYIRPTISANLDLFAEIEPVPGADIFANISGIFSADLQANLETSEPVNLDATLSGQPAADLTGNYFGYEISDLLATLTGTSIADLQALILPVESGVRNLNAQIAGFLGIEQEALLNSYVRGTESGSVSISASIQGISFKDLNTTVFGYTFTGLDSSISGVLFDGALEAQITPTGGINNLTAYITPTENTADILNAYIDGGQHSDLIAQLNSSPHSLLQGSITSTGVYNQGLDAQIVANLAETLSGTYDTIRGNLLDAIITPIPASELTGIIRPKAFYIDSSILINTYPINELQAVINSDPCLTQSDYKDLIVTISGISSADLSASIIPVVGQLAIATDLIELSIKEKVIDQDWVFLILDQGAISQDYLQLVFANSPLKDLSATIFGVQANSDLKAEVSVKYIPSIPSPGVPLGQWVNLKTGDSKLLRLSFKGNAINYYYSEEANNALSDGSKDFLDIIVESYKRQDPNFNSLLNLKTEVKQARVSLDGFNTLDEAIKYAIAYSVSEIYGSLRAEITGIGLPSSLNSSISGVDSTYISDLNAKLVTTTVDPTLSGIITPTGGVMDLQALINPVQAQITSTPFFDSSGQRYLPTLNIISNGNYSVVLTPITTSAIINVVSPDLETTICGVGVFDLDATVSGI